MKILLAGDSTVATCPDNEAPMAGWGQFLQDYIPKEIQVVNIAKGGSTTASFRADQLWDMLLKQMKVSDIVCIQFGHNDQKPERKIYTEDYVANLQRMVREVKANRGIPVLITPPERNNFFLNELFPTLEKEATIVRTLAEEEDLLCIDLHKQTKDWYRKKGELENRKHFVWLKPGEHENYPDGFRDNTHFSEAGSRLIAEWISNCLIEKMIRS
ncbi:rhamnogalacturonan acetylesterase [Trichococcus flocculiformis]|uniref:rhamnogalacturonan acetylesterase n=1 Tax=Trichococcus flocculiformis TaxID=82803 RepID=UPI002AAC4A06|nr:rhamnogalacturonan acetylesterase [Trichococcus flocculiformis]